MTSQAIFHRYFPVLYLGFAGLLGWAGGWLVAVALGIWLTPPVDGGQAAAFFPTAAAAKRPLAEYQIILDRNIFNSAAGSAGSFADRETAAPIVATVSEQQAPAPRVPLDLVGTVVAGPDSLAVIRDGREIRVYRLRGEVGGRTIDEIGRQNVVLRHRDGSLENLSLPTEPVPPGRMTAAAPAPRTRLASQGAGAGPLTSSFNIQQVGENRWSIPKDAADHARSNLNELLTQAHMEPRIVAGETSGFVVRMVRPGSLFDLLGLRRGDVLMEVNEIQLSSPERALQVFQQLREARDIKVSLLRNDEPMTFEYETN